MKKFELVVSSDFEAFLPEKEQAKLEEKITKAVNRVLMNTKTMGNFHVNNTKTDVVKVE